MERCKDCIHYEVCELYKTLGAYFINKDCGFFRNKVQHRESIWIKYGNKRTCQNCDYSFWSSGQEFKYCPDCGAKMKGKV